MSQKKQRNNTFFGGAAILAVGIVLVKVISMFYKLPLVNILGSSGYADFTAAFNVFNILLTISTGRRTGGSVQDDLRGQRQGPSESDPQNL